MSLHAEEVQRLATLARLDLNPAEQAALLADLNAVLGLIDRLQSVDTQGVKPLTHPQALALRLRDDAVTESNAREALQAGAPRVEAGLYLVPKVIE
ncbi:MAG: Asp-tRNA(Asn)/Glu-tRNA(Gln) amidotransferase subunit GatC [Betaproteobacteria bacterium]